MRRLKAIAVATMLSVVALGVTSCGSAGAITVPPGALVCLAQVGFTVLQEEKPSLLDYYDIAKTCARPVTDLAAQLTGSQELQALVQELPNDPTFQFTFDGTLINNCASGSSVTGTYSYNIPLVLIVGSSDSSGTFNGTTFVEPLPYIPPDPAAYELLPAAGQPFQATTDAERIAQAVYAKEDLPQYFNAPGKPSDSFLLTIPAHSEVTLHLPLVITYRIGEGVVNHGGQAAGSGMLWAYTPYGTRDFDPANLTAQEKVVIPC